MLYSIQAYRGIAVLLVALFHGTIRVEQEYGLAPLNDVFSLGFSGVHLFFVLSGFIILTAHIRDVGVPSRLSWYLKRRFIRIYPIYWVVLLVLGGWQLLFVKGDLEEFALNAFFFMSNGRLVIPVSWTLLYEVIFYVMFAVLVVNRRIGIVVMAAWLAAILWSWGSASLHILHPFNLLFLIGLASGALFFRLRAAAPSAIGIISAGSFAVGVVLFVGTAVAYSGLGVAATAWPDHPLTILGFGLATALLVLGAASPRIEAFFRERELLLLMGNASYSIYLVHLWAEKTAYKLVKALNPELAAGTGQNPFVSDLLLLFIVVVAVLCGILVHLKIERPLLAYLREKMRATRAA